MPNEHSDTPSNIDECRSLLQRFTRHSLFPTTVVAGFALLLRLWNIGAESIWIDESATLRRSQMGLGEMVANCATHGQLPLYNLMMNLWTRLAGTGEVALRLPSALLGSLNVLLAYLAVHRLMWDHRKLPWPRLTRLTFRQQHGSTSEGAEPEPMATAERNDPETVPTSNPGSLQLGPVNLDWPLVVALLAATQPVLVYFGQEGRTYTLMLTACWVVALTVLVPLRWDRPLRGREPGLLCLALAVLTLSHYIGWVVAAGTLAVYIYHMHRLGLFGRQRGQEGRAGDKNGIPAVSLRLGACLPLLATLLPILLWLAYMSSGGNWPNSSFHRSSSLGETLGQWKSEDFAPLAVFLAPLIMAALLGLRALLRTHRPLAGACLLWALGLPLIVVGGAAATRNFFAARYLLPIIVPVLILTGRGIFEKLPAIAWKRPVGKRRPPAPSHIGAVLLVLILLLSLGQTAWLATTSQKPEWREAGALIDANAQSWDLVAVAPDWERDTLDYYLETEGCPLTVDQAVSKLQGSGPASVATLWVVFRHDRTDERKGLEEQLGPDFMARISGKVYQLEIWQFEPMVD